MGNTIGIAAVYTSQSAPSDQSRLSTFVHAVGDGTQKFLSGTWQDFKTTNRSSAKTVLTVGVANPLVGRFFADYYETRMPLGWMLSRFGPLPVEFAANGTLRVFELTFAQRAMLVAKGAIARFALVTVAFEGGVLIGSAINQVLPDDVKDAIGGTINEIINERGWQELWKHPFGIGL